MVDPERELDHADLHAREVGSERSSPPPFVILICGSTGAGKTSYALELADRTGAVRFSIDPWMQTLFAPDLEELDFEWMLERTRRCEEQMWEVAAQLLARRTPVIFDLGFFSREHRDRHRRRAGDLGVGVSVHFVDTPVEERRRRVSERNRLKPPRLYAFEVTTPMFDFMEPRFEAPDEEELRGGLRIGAG